MAVARLLSTRALLFSVAVALLVAVFFWNTLPLYPFRLMVTLMHESGHAVTTVLLGGHVQSVTISPTAGGLTLSAYPMALWRAVLVGSAGYVGSAVSGAVLLWAASRMRSGRLLLTLLVVWMVAVAWEWVPLFPPRMEGGAAFASGYARADGLFTLAFIIVDSAALFLVAWKGPLWLRQLLVIFIATLSCFNAVQDIKWLFHYGMGGSDADAMAKLTHIPAVLWASAWMLLSIGAISLGLRSIILRRGPR